MDLFMDNDDDHLDDLAEDDADEEALNPEEIDEDQESTSVDSDDEDSDEDWGDEFPPDLHSLGVRFRNIGVRTIFERLERYHDGPKTVAPIVLYLLYPDLRQEIVQSLRDAMISGEEIEDMFLELGELNVSEQIEHECPEAMLEFVDVLGSLMVGTHRLLPGFRQHNVTLPLHIPFGAVVVAKLLQYPQSVESVQQLTLKCKHQYRAFRPNEAEQLVNSIINLKQLDRLEISMDMTGALLVELCARLKDHRNLSFLYIRGRDRIVPQELPNERQVMRTIPQISSLDTLFLFLVVMGESTVDLFSSSKAAYTKLTLVSCLHVIGDTQGKDPSEIPLAVALASNTRLEELCLNSVQGTDAFFVGIEQGLLNNRTLRTLRLTNYSGAAHQRIPEFAYFGWIRSIRLHPSLRRLELDMNTWSGRVADAVCSVIRDNTSLHSIGFFRESYLWRNDNEIDPEWVGAVFQALQANRTIVDVRIRVGSDFGDQNWTRLAALLNANESIETIHLDVGSESIPERVVELLQRVKSNRTLKRLGLKNASFRRKHTRALARILSKNYALVSLDYDHNKANDDVKGRERNPISCFDYGSLSLLKGMLELNYYGREYMRTEPNSVFRGVSLLSHVATNLDAVYFHIRENPRLCDRREWK